MKSKTEKLLDELLYLHPKYIDLSLDRLKKLLNKLGDPHLDLPKTIHIAGTNGKGSVQSFIRNILTFNGYTCDAYISPHLTKFNERIVLNNKDVRVTDRLSLPRNNLKGFKPGRIGPVDNGDYVGGNYAASLNFDTTLPMLFPSAETMDFKYFVDVGNVWGIDYSDTLDESNKIRSSTGVTIDWFTPIGPLNFTFSQDITKATADQTESFQFNLGTTF